MEDPPTEVLVPWRSRPELGLSHHLETLGSEEMRETAASSWLSHLTVGNVFPLWHFLFLLRAMGT